jgi:ABC-type nickel/cobalt efflux system permease component RcnA
MKRVLAVLCVALLPSAARAHPVPKDNHDRTLLVTLTPEAVLIDYRLEVAEERALLDLAKEKPSALVKGLSRRELCVEFARTFAPLRAGALYVTLDGEPLPVTCERRSFTVTDHVAFTFHYRAAWRPTPKVEHTFHFTEGDYDLDNFSYLALRVSVSPRLTARRVLAPGEDVIARSGRERAPGDDRLLREVTVSFATVPSAEPGAARPAVEPPPTPPKRSPRLGQKVGAARPGGPGGKAREGPAKEKGAEEAAVEGEAPAKPTKLLHLLFDTRKGLAVLLVLAAGFGAAHALTPGHGKAMVAAYLVGQHGTVWHAVLLGLVITLTHTAAVLVVAGVLPLLWPNAPPAEVQMILGGVGGLLIAGLGLWLLMRRLSGQADHFHLGGHSHGHGHGHDHSHGHGHGHGYSHGDASGPPSIWGLVTLGVGGGIVPCTDAIFLLALAISAQQLPLALPLLLAFSAGLAAVLVALGIAVVQARNLASARWGAGGRWQRLAAALPVVSAALVTALGLWLCFDSFRGH